MKLISLLKPYILVTIPVQKIRDIRTHINQLEKVGYNYEVISIMYAPGSGRLRPHHVLIREVVEGDPPELIRGELE